MADDVELVVLVDDQGRPTGTAPKQTVHTADTPLHLAFSAYLLNDAGELLVTRRALSKKTWPGVWTNSMCGHPGPNEPMADAIARRGDQELGLAANAINEITVPLTDYRYRAEDSSGIVEFEICPVHVVTLMTNAVLAPRHEEVEEWQWVAAAQLFDAVDNAPFAFSPWMVDQLSNPKLRVAILDAVEKTAS